MGLGFIGFGLIGKRHVLDFKDQPEAEVVAVAEVARAAAAMKAWRLAAGMPADTPTFGLCSTIAG